MSEHDSPASSTPPSEHNVPPQSNGEPAASGGSTDTLPTPPENAPGIPPLHLGAVQECLQSIQRFRGGEYSREEALFQIYDSLGNATPSRAAYLQAAKVYIDMVDTVVAERRGAEGQGQTFAGQQAREGDAQGEDEVGHTPDDCESVFAAERPKRRCAPVNDDSDEDDEPRGGKRPLDLSSMPWLQDESTVPLSGPLEDTRKALALFAEDLKRWKTFFTNHPGCPQFPDSEWTNVLAGCAINLDLVFGSMFNVSHENKHKEQVGRLSFTLDDVAPAKVVKSHSDWLSAWRRASDATAFIFRHRRDELDQYCTHISSMFSSVAEAHHDRVLIYEKGVRSRASSKRDLLLSDFGRYTDIYTYWLSAYGAGAVAGPSCASGSCPAAKPNKREPCRRWNDGKCPFSASQCNYLHSCQKCRSSAHTSGACTQRA